TGDVLDRESLHLEVGAGGDVDDAVAVFVAEIGDFTGLLGREFAAGDANANHVAAGRVAFAIKHAVPFHPLEIGGRDLLHWRAGFGVMKNVGPDVEAVFFGLPNFDGMGHERTGTVEGGTRVRIRPIREALRSGWRRVA